MKINDTSGYVNLSAHEAIYPGHPITIAYVITQRYKSFVEATTIGSTFPAALEDDKVPGGGGRVYCALDLLRKRQEGEDWDSLFQWADHVWDSERFSKHAEGLEQAHALKEKLIESYWKDTE